MGINYSVFSSTRCKNCGEEFTRENKRNYRLCPSCREARQTGPRPSIEVRATELLTNIANQFSQQEFTIKDILVHCNPRKASEVACRAHINRLIENSRVEIVDLGTPTKNGGRRYRLIPSPPESDK